MPEVTLSHKSKVSYRVGAARLIAGREFRAAFYGIGMYIVFAVSFLAASFLIAGQASTIKEAGLQVAIDPLGAPLYLMLIIITLYLGISATVSISRERDQGTMEVLFYGPVDGFSYVIGKYLEHMAAFIIMLLVSLGFLWMASAFTKFLFTPGVIRIASLSILVVSCMVCFGIFLSAVTGRVRNSILLFILIMVAFAGIEFLRDYMLSLQGEVSAPVEYSRAVVAWVARGVGWISPLAYLSRGAEAARVGDVRGLLIGILSPIIYTGVLLWLSMIAFGKRGVRK